MSLSEAQVRETLGKVVDPNTGKDFVSSRAVKNLKVAGDAVSLEIELGYPGRSQFEPIRRKVIDALKAAGREVGSIQIQNRATIGGNLCNASPAADGVPPLLALEADVELVSAAASRRLPLSGFILGNRRTALKSDEILSTIIVPAQRVAGTAVSTFVKLGARHYLVISIAMVAVNLVRGDDGRIGDAKIAVGSCSAVAQRLHGLESELLGKPAAAGLGRMVEARHLSALSPIDDVRASGVYRRDAALSLVRRAIETCVTGAGQ